MDNKTHWYKLHELRPVRPPRSSSGTREGGTSGSRDKSRVGVIVHVWAFHIGNTLSLQLNFRMVVLIEKDIAAELNLTALQRTKVKGD